MCPKIRYDTNLEKKLDFWEETKQGKTVLTCSRAPYGQNWFQPSGQPICHVRTYWNMRCQKFSP